MLEILHYYQQTEKMNMKKKRRYMKPSVKVFELQQQPILLVGSNGLDGLPNFAPGGNPVGS